jgi:hypothetical protein
LVAAATAREPVVAVVAGECLRQGCPANRDERNQNGRSQGDRPSLHRRSLLLESEKPPPLFVTFVLQPRRAARITQMSDFLENHNAAGGAAGS